MDSIERMEITEKIEEPLNEAGENLKSINKNKKILQIKEVKELLEEINENHKDIKTTMTEVQNGRSLTINGLKDDVEKFSTNSQKFEEQLKKARMDQISRINIKSLSSNALIIKNIIYQR